MKSQRTISWDRLRKPIYYRMSPILAGTLVVSLLFMAVCSAHAAETNSVLEITVGYEGGKAYTKQTISLDETTENKIDMQKQIYTWIDETKSCGTTEAEGIYLTDLLKYAEVKGTDSIKAYSFVMPQEDETEEYVVVDITDKELFEGESTERYTVSEAYRQALNDYNNCDDKDVYLNDPDNYYTIQDIYDASFGKKEYTESAWKLRNAVEPMLALRFRTDYWTAGQVPPTALKYDSLKDADGPVLLYGQASKNDINKTEKSQVITKIQIWFEGEPDISLTDKNLKGEVGSTGTVTVNVNAPDDTLKEKITSELKLQSSNESVATVDQTGKVSFKKKGSTIISVVYDSDGDGKTESFGTVSVSVSEKNQSSGSTSGGSSDQSQNKSGGSSSGGSGNQSSGNTSGSGDSSSSGDTSGSSGSEGTSSSTGSAGESSTVAVNPSRVGNSVGVTFTPRTTTVSNTVPRSTTTGQQSAAATGSRSNTTNAATNNRSVAVGQNEAEADTMAELDEQSGQMAYEVTEAEETSALGGDDAGGNRGILMLLGGAIALVCGVFAATLYYWRQTEEPIFLKKIKGQKAV